MVTEVMPHASLEASVEASAAGTLDIANDASAAFLGGMGGRSYVIMCLSTNSRSFPSYSDDTVVSDRTGGTQGQTPKCSAAADPVQILVLYYPLG